LSFLKLRKAVSSRFFSMELVFGGEWGSG